MDGQSIGVVRFDITGDEANISIYLVPGQSSRGYGTELLLVAEKWLANARSDVQILRAEVLDANGKSHKLFDGAGYSADTTEFCKRLN